MIKDKLIEKQKELIKFYGERLADNAMFLHIHHMAETPENCRIGETLRNEITELEKEFEQEVITDADIEAWADSKYTNHLKYWTGAVEGAKAMRDGEIKHIET
jgi:hypothetical protein